jgi:hypothetical protein
MHTSGNASSGQPLEKTTGLGKLKKLDVSMDAESTKNKYHQKVGSMENWGMAESLELMERRRTEGERVATLQPSDGPPWLNRG